jgi:hypothetical protein
MNHARQLRLLRVSGHRAGPVAVQAGLVIGLSAVLLAACAGGVSSTSAPPTTRSSPAVTTPSSAPLAAYRAMWADLVSAAQTSDFQSTQLSQHTTGQALTLFVQGLAWDQLHGIVTRGEPVLHPVVTSLSPNPDPTRATVTDCFEDTHWLEYKTSGGLAKKTAGGRRATTAELVKTAGTWKVTQITVGKTGTC